MAGGIYKIENTVNGKVYIGSTYSFSRRKDQHYSDLRLGRHKNIHLQSAWDKYGEHCFIFMPVEIVHDLSSVHEREEYWLNFFREEGEVYNMGVCAANAWRGVKRPEETIERMRAAQKGKGFSKEVSILASQRAAEITRGVPRSEETKARISEGLKRAWERRNGRGNG